MPATRRPGSGNAHWNTAGATGDCGVLAFSGGAGVAAADGTVYFVSPEALDGQGVKNAPNLFVDRPGATPQLVATIDPDNPALLHAVTENEFHRYGDFQVTPDGDYAVFATTVPLTNYPTYGHSEIYRYATEGGIDVRVLPAVERRGDQRRDPHTPGPEPRRRRPRLLHHRRPARPARYRRQPGRLRVDAGRSAADLDRLQRHGLGAGDRQRRRRAMPSSSRGRSSSRGTKTATR